MWKDILLDVFRPLYIVASLLLSVYSFYLLALTILFWWQRLTKKTIAPPVAGNLEDMNLPVVAIQIPLYNESRVAARVIDAAAQMDYPPQKLHIQILDDSTDETEAIVAERVQYWQGLGIWITCHHRDNRQDFKAGALKEGMQHTPADLLAIFDADFVPPSVWLRQAVQPYLQPDATRLGFVQTRWTHINDDYSLSTQAQALGLDGVFGVEHPVCTHYGLFKFMNGTGMLLRRQAIEDAGGWQGEVLVEDMDLCLRMQLRGWTATYLRDVTAPAELPGLMASYKIQQFRWAKGSMQVARRLAGPIARSHLPFWTKAHVLVRMLSYLVCPLILLTLCLALPLYSWSGLWLDRLPFQYLSFAGLGFPLFFLSAQITLYPRKQWWKVLMRLPLLSMMGLGMAANNTLAVWEGLTLKKSVFQRTPKFGIGKQDRIQLRTIPVQMRLSPTHWLELLIAAYALLAALISVWGGNRVAGFFFVAYIVGFAWVAGAELVENLAARRHGMKLP